MVYAFLGEIRTTNEVGTRRTDWLNLAGKVSEAVGGIGCARIAHTLCGR
ncbi:hypothetical protein [Paraburkholderia sp. JHI869]